MRLKLFYILHSYWILKSYGQYVGSGGISTVTNFGHNRWHGATGFNQPAARVLNKPIYYNLNNAHGSSIPGHSMLQFTPGGFSYNTLHSSPAFNPGFSYNTLHSSPAFNPTPRTTNAFHVPRAASAPAAVNVMGQPSSQNAGPLPLLLPLSNPHTLQNNRKRNIPPVASPSSENPYLNKHNYVESPTATTAEPQNVPLLPKSGRHSARMPIRQAGFVSSFVEPIQGSQDLVEDAYDEIPWTAEYDGTFWDSAADIKAPLAITKIMISFSLFLAYQYIY